MNTALESCSKSAFVVSILLVLMQQYNERSQFTFPMCSEILVLFEVTKTFKPHSHFYYSFAISFKVEIICKILIAGVHISIDTHDSFPIADIPNHIFIVHVLNSKLYFTSQEYQFPRYTDRGAALFFLKVSLMYFHLKLFRTNSYRCKMKQKVM